MTISVIQDALLLPFLWVFLFMLTTTVGLALIPFRNNKGILSSNFFTWFWYGLGIIIGFLQVWNLFLPVNPYSFIPLLAISVLGITKINKQDWLLFKNIGWFSAIALSIILLFLVLSSLDDSFIYDSLVYHFYTIKWLNALPVTKGMGNLFLYLGLNQSYFLFPAFVNSLWNHYKGACATNGFFAFVICFEIISNNARYFAKKDKLTFLAFFQLLFIPLCINVGVQNLSSPTPDVFVNLLTFKILSDIIRCIENEKVTFQDIFLLTYFCLVGVIMKLSFIGVGLGAFTLIVFLGFRDRLWKQTSIIQSILIFLGFVIPWLIRGIISSGYIGFPISSLGLPVDWRMPKDVLITLSAFIKGFARTHLHGRAGIDAAYNYSWIGDWTKRMLHTTGFILSISTLLLSIVLLKIKRIDLSKLLIVLTPLSIAIIFWFFTAPDIRFAVFTFWALGIIPVAYMISSFKISWISNKGFIAFISICSFVVIIRNWNTDLAPLGSLPQQNMSVFTTKSGLKINTVKNVPPYGDDWQISDCSIPCSVFPDSNLVLRGVEIKDGFRISSPISRNDH